MAEHHGAEHHVLGQLLGLRLDHQHGVGGAGDDEVELRFRGISSSVGLRTYSLLTKPTRAAPIGPMKGAPDRRQRRRRRDQREDVGIVLEVVRQRRHDDLRLVAPAVGEQRTDRAVDEAGDQRLLLGRTALALEVAARDAAGGVVFLLVVDGERQEVDALARLLRRDDGREHGGLAVGGEDGAVGLAGYLAGFEDELTAAPIELNTMDIEHIGLLSWFSRTGESHEQDGERPPRAWGAAKAASGDPAMAFEPFVGSPGRVARDVAGGLGPPDSKRERKARSLRYTRGKFPREQTYRRIPSRSIRVL